MFLLSVIYLFLISIVNNQHQLINQLVFLFKHQTKGASKFDKQWLFFSMKTWWKYNNKKNMSDTFNGVLSFDIEWQALNSPEKSIKQSESGNWLFFLKYINPIVLQHSAHLLYTHLRKLSKHTRIMVKNLYVFFLFF